MILGMDSVLVALLLTRKVVSIYKRHFALVSGCPTWDEKFAFWVDDLKDSLVISVMDEDKFFNYEYVGRLKVPISLVFEEEIKSLGTAWYSLKSKNKKYKNKQCGILYFSTELSYEDSIIAIVCICIF